MKLKPCPFCGARWEDGSWQDQTMRHSEDCWFLVNSRVVSSSELWKEAWNRRKGFRVSREKMSK